MKLHRLYNTTNPNVARSLADYLACCLCRFECIHSFTTGWTFSALITDEHDKIAKMMVGTFTKAMNDHLSEAELQKLKACTSNKEWNAACGEVKRVRNGQYPLDWYDVMLASGLVHVITSRFTS